MGAPQRRVACGCVWKLWEDAGTLCGVRVPDRFLLRRRCAKPCRRPDRELPKAWPFREVGRCPHLAGAAWCLVSVLPSPKNDVPPEN